MQIEVLGERYQLQDPIGRGGMATIYRGRDMRMDRAVAIKVLREVYSTDPKFVTRFQREAKAASSLQHPNIVQVYDYGQSDGNYFIVMELVEGTDLRRYLRSRGVLAIDRAIIIAHDVALGLGAAHRRGIVHRDVKPQNVLVGRDGSIKLTDFGIASVYKDINAERLTTTGMTLGTVQYYAPEQAQGEIVSPAADVYALGIVMYEMLTGRTPFDGDTPVAVAMQHIQDAPQPPSQLNPNIPPALEEIILRCLEKEPTARFRDGSVLARALEMLGEDEISGMLPANVAPGTTVHTPSPSSPNQAQFAANGAFAPAASSPNNRMTSSPYSTQMQIENTVNAAPSEQPYSPFPGALPASQSQAPYAPIPPEASGATRPFRKGRSGVVQDQHESRFDSIITVLILAAALLMLGFSVYLAGELGYLKIPGLGPKDQTPVVQEVQVPALVGLDLDAAKTTATKAGFKLCGEDNVRTGKVQKQNPDANSKAAPGSCIYVDLLQPTPTVTVPRLLGPLADAEQALSNTSCPPQYPLQYNIVPDGTDPTQPANMVIKTDPAAGKTITCGQKVTLYVLNDTNGATPTPVATQPPASPTATQPPTSPTAQPSPSPSPKPSPSPSPSPSPKPSPSPSPSPSPTAKN